MHIQYEICADEAWTTDSELEEEDVRETCKCEYDGSVAFVVDREEDDDVELTEEEWKEVRDVRHALARAKLPRGMMRLHRGQCDEDECPSWPARRVGVFVTLDLGSGVILEREYMA